MKPHTHTMFDHAFFTGLDHFLHGLNNLFGKAADVHCRLETASDDYTLAADDDSLVSIIQLHGAMNLVGQEEFKAITHRITEDLNSRMTKSGHAMQIVFNYDPTESPYEIKELMRPARVTSRNIGMDINGLFDDQEKTLAQYCAAEHIWISLWTRPFILPPAALKNARIASVNRINKAPIARDCQVVTRGMREIADDHAAFVEGILTGMRSINLVADKMIAHDVLWHIRRRMDRGYTGRDWRPRLPGDPLPMQFSDPGEDDLSRFLYPSFGKQMFPRDPENVSGNLLKIGDSWHGSVVMELPPQTPKPFNALFKSMLGSHIPWSAGFLIEGNGLTGLMLKQLLSSILHLTSSNNKKFNAAMEQLNDKVLQGESIVRFRATFSTSLHGEVSQEIALKTLNERTSILASTIQSWGTADVRDVVSDPMLGLLATVPAMMPSNPAPTCAAPLADIMKMMPLTRPASVWDKGNILFRSPDGKIMPFQMGSSKQAAWVDIGVAPMGGGKSVLLNTLNFGFCTQAGLTRLPWLSIIDIGPSSSGLIELVRSGLPKDKKYLAQYHRLRMEADYAINPFDLPLGMSTPLPQHKSFLTNILSLFATELNAIAPQDGVAGIARACIEAAYEEYSPQRSPKIYVRHVAPIVDSVVDALGLHIDARTSWWEIRDALFDAGYVHEAISAQRYAVPLLSEVAAMARRDIVTGIFKHVTPGQEPITDFFWRACVDAISAYPILKAPTRFDIGDAQIVSLDLDEVAPRGSADADRQTAVMYMLARHVLASRFFLMPRDVGNADPRYKAWHTERIEQIRQDPKRLCYDETHRVMRSAAVAQQVVGDLETIARESRKWNISLGLYSQSIEDYPDIIIELATSIYILGVGTVKMAEYLTKRFGLNQASLDSMQRLGKPDKRGANLLAIFKTGNGQSVQHLTSTIGTQALWAFSSTTEDTTVRNRLYATLGVAETLKRLAKRYPGGIKAEADRRKEIVEDKGMDSVSVDILNEITQEILTL